MLRRMKRKPSRALFAPAASVSPGFKILRFLLRPFGYEIQPRQLAPEVRKRAVGGAGRMDKVMAGALRTWLNTHPKARLVFRHVRRLENLLRCGQSGAIDLDLIAGCADELCRAGLERSWVMEYLDYREALLWRQPRPPDLYRVDEIFETPVPARIAGKTAGV